MKIIAKLACLTITALSLSAAPLYADEVAELEAGGIAVWQMLPRPSEMIRHPGAESYAFYGKTGETKSMAADVPGGKAMSVAIGGMGKTAWDAGANVPTQVKTKKGDVLVAVIYARAAELPEGASETVMAIHIQEQGGDYAQYGTEQARLTTRWGQYVVYGTLGKKYKKGAVGAALHLATGEQTIELGPVYIMNLGQGAVDPAVMPKSGLLPE